MIEAPLALAFGAGLLATFNPCGFAMLPAYLSYFMGLNDDADRGRGASLRSALTVGAVVSFGFLLVFGIANAACSRYSSDRAHSPQNVDRDVRDC